MSTGGSTAIPGGRDGANPARHVCVNDAGPCSIGTPSRILPPPRFRSGMNHATSLYLDVLRLAAALGVFFGHASLGWFSGELGAFPHRGHEFVVLFFFLSGYVIADSTLGRARSLGDYVVARLSRLESVVFPGVLLTLALGGVGAWINPVFYAGFERGYEVVRGLLSVLFLQEVWFLSASPASNNPLWSLGYEFWFYVLFGVACYGRGKRWRLGLGLAVAIVAGPKVLLLLPVWLLGVAGWWLRGRWRLRRIPARAGWGLTLAAGIWLTGYSGFFPATDLAVAPWFYSSHALRDLTLGIVIFGHVFCFEHGFAGLKLLPWMEWLLRRGAGLTFSLYVYHFPLLVFCAAVVPYDPASVAQVLAVTLIVLFVAGVLGALTELRRGVLRAWLVRRFNLENGSSRRTDDVRPALRMNEDKG